MTSHRYRRIPLSQDRLRDYERRHYQVTTKQEGNYTDYDIDILEHCQQVKVPYFLIHHPRRYCTVLLDWSTAGFELTLPSYRQVEQWAQQAQDRSPASKAQKKGPPHVTPKELTVHGLELDHARQLCQHVWEWLIRDAQILLTPDGGDAA